MENEKEKLFQSLARIELEIQQMQRDTTHGKKKPHKLVMLLAVIDLFEKAEITDNKIPYNDKLVESFSDIFNLIRSKGEWNQPAPPYFHLRSSKFWHHKIIIGREVEYQKIKTSGGGSKRIIENIEYAYLSEYFFNVMKDDRYRRELKEFIIVSLNPYGNFKDTAPISRPIVGTE
jgi:predicted restriction endonuclease